MISKSITNLQFADVSYNSAQSTSCSFDQSPATSSRYRLTTAFLSSSYFHIPFSFLIPPIAQVLNACFYILALPPLIADTLLSRSQLKHCSPLRRGQLNRWMLPQWGDHRTVWILAFCLAFSFCDFPKLTFLFVFLLGTDILALVQIGSQCPNSSSCHPRCSWRQRV